MNCAHTNIANDCGCIGARSFYPPVTAPPMQLSNCTLEKIYCILDALSSPKKCRCPAACTKLHFEATVSYSYYPAEHIISNRLAQSTILTPSDFHANLLEVNVFFESLNVETVTTNDAYSFIALLGGQVGLFLHGTECDLCIGVWGLDY